MKVSSSQLRIHNPKLNGVFIWGKIIGLTAFIIQLGIENIMWRSFGIIIIILFTFLDLFPRIWSKITNTPFWVKPNKTTAKAIQRQINKKPKGLFSQVSKTVLVIMAIFSIWFLLILFTNN